MGRLQRAFISYLFVPAAVTWSPANAVDFSRDIQPIFSGHCYKCHGTEKQKSSYRLDEKLTAFRGGDSGKPAIVVSNSTASALFQRIATSSTDEMMPPKGARLTSKEVLAVRAWIDSGAPWPDTLGQSIRPSSTHWSFQPIRKPELPRVRNSGWVRNPIDCFVLARLEREKLKPSPEAGRATLIRRLHLDLTGLPPTPDEVDAFLNDRRHDAYEHLVDALLASPHFGERWGRHWLDLARYADSAGYQIDRVRPGAYLYRDWVVDSINRDQPFDQFTIEQLAGDLLLNASMEQKIATGFHRMTLSNFEDGVDKVEFECKAKADRVATTGTAWLGLTVGCAECHSHKFDPISQREFYELYAFFDRTEERDVPTPNPAEREKFNRAHKVWELEKARLQEARSNYAKTELPAKQSEWERTVNPATLTNAVAQILSIEAGQRSADQRRELAKYYGSIDPKMNDLAAQLKAHQRNAPQYREEQAMLMADLTNAPKTFVHVRGDFLTPGDEVAPGVLHVLNAFHPRGSGGEAAHSSKSQPDQTVATSAAATMGADRLDLARWIVSPENPLTARVAVNRFWLHLFGRGIVNTPEDFGTRGEAPSHPELLDWLASEFQRVAWSRKQIIRTIVTSATYRQSSRMRPELLERDPQNVLLARQGRFRIESEIVRDLFLSVSGLLDPEIGGPSIYPPIPEDVKAVGYGVGGPWVDTEAPEKYRRGLYVISRRTVPYPTAMTFDQANANECTAQRERSNTPLQPLALLNNPVFAECADALAVRFARAPGRTRDKLQFAFRLCLGRAPARDELKRLEQLVHDETEIAHASESRAWRGVAEVMLNLDEFLTRE